MILFTTSSASILFLLSGQYPGPVKYDYFLWFVGVGALGTLLGQTLMATLIQRFERPSFIVFFLAASIGFSCLLMSLEGVLSLDWQLQHGELDLALQPLCPPSPRSPTADRRSVQIKRYS